MRELLLAGLALLAVAGLVDLTAGIGRPWVRPVPYLIGAAGSVCLLVVGVRAVLGTTTRVDLGNALGFGSSALLADPLAGLFLTLTSGVAVAVSLGFASWVRPAGRVRGRGLGAASALLLGAVVVIVLARDAFVFLFAWESLTVAFSLLAGYERRRRGRADASFLTLAIGKTSGSLLLVGFLLLSARSGSFTLESWAGVPGGVLRSSAYVLVVLGFGAKVGLVPLQVWMPPGYAAAPGPARALMGAAAVNVGFYGLWRVLGVLGGPPLWLAIAVLLLASSTALLGVAHAAVQGNLQRVIAYSSVENGGLILTGYGVALAGASLQQTRLVAVGLLAGTLQAVAHALGKGTLFLASGTIEAAIGTVRLDDLRGTGRRLPWSGTGFGIGALALAGLPPTVGFALEWFLLEALMQQFRLSGLAVKLAMAFAGALVALTAGFAAVAFVRVLGLTILGSDRPRRDRPDRLPEVGVAGRVGLGVLALGCLAVAAVTPLEIRYLARGLTPVVSSEVTLGALGSPWVLHPVYPKFSVLSPSWLWVTMPLLLVLVAGLTLLASRASVLRIRLVPAWRSATGGVAGQDRYTAFGYAHPTRRVLANVLLTRSEVRELEREPGDGQNGEPGAALGYRSDVVDVVGAFVYRPFRRPLRGLVQAVKRLQSGRLDAYVAYMLVAVVGVLAVVAATG